MNTKKLSVAEEKQHKSESRLGFLFILIIALVMAGFFFFSEALNEAISLDETTSKQSSTWTTSQPSKNQDAT